MKFNALKKLFVPDPYDFTFPLKQRILTDKVALLSLGTTHAKLAVWNANAGLRDIECFSLTERNLTDVCAKAIAPSKWICVSLADPIKIVTSTNPEGALALGNGRFISCIYDKQYLDFVKEQLRSFNCLRFLSEPLGLLSLIMPHLSQGYLVLATHNTQIVGEFVDGKCLGISKFEQALPETVLKDALIYKSDTFTKNLVWSNSFQEHLELEMLCA